MDTMDKIFRALSDPSRRKILDIVKNDPGINVNKISEYFDFTRYAVMKHLNILEEAELIVPQRVGKFKKLYINVMPIQMVYDRWISKYSELWAKNLSSLKHSLEKEDTAMSQQNLSHVFVLYIKTKKEKLWEALTDPEKTRQYFYGTAIKSDLKKGSTIEYKSTDREGKENIALFGEITEVVPYKRLVHTFNFPGNDDKTTRAVYEIEEVDSGVKLTLTHDQFPEVNETYKSVGEGWPFILSGLKTLLETGKPLAA